MKCTILEISWHNRDPVLSIDIENKINKNVDGSSFWRLATGGTDSHVVIWHLSVNEAGTATVNCVADLTRHQKGINVVRFSPSGEILASGDDDSVIILWKQREASEPPPLAGEENFNKEQWTSWRVLRKHHEDVHDISWSPNSNMLVSGSVDNTAIVWDVQKGKNISILQDFKGFVQGVAWDPCNHHIAALSSDRFCRLIDVNTMKTVQKVYKGKIPTPPGHPLENKIMKLFHDDTFKSFFRRLTYTIDGSLIIATSGIIEPQESTDSLLNATMVFSRNNIKEPIMILPTLNEITIGVKCCPIYFELRSDGPIALIALPYRLVFAIVTEKSVLIYDTQQISPIAVISNIHYTRLTDVAWSSDGQILMVSSTDGYCSVIHFEDGELGEVYKADKPLIINQNNKNNNKKEKLSKKTKISEKTVKKDLSPDINNEVMDVDVSKFEINKIIKKSEDVILEKNVENKVEEEEESKPTEEKNETKSEEALLDVDDTEDIKLVYEVGSESSDDSPPKNVLKKIEDNQELPPPKIIPPLITRTPRRVPLITLSSPNRKKASGK